MASAEKITFNDVMNWLFSNEPMPERFTNNRTKLNSIVPYIPEQLWNNLELTSFLNDQMNDLHNIPDSVKQLEALRTIFRARGITRGHLWKFFPKREPDYVQKIMDLEGHDESNARSKNRMMSFTKVTRPEFYKAKQDTKNKENLALVKNALEIENIEKEKLLNKEVNDDLYLKELNQEIIDDLELTLFNTKLLKKRNEVLITFIDKNNKKRYFLMPFEASFYITKSPSVIHNDYIMEPDKNFRRYTINDWNLFNRLKFALNHAYKRSINDV